MGHFVHHGELTYCWLRKMLYVSTPTENYVDKFFLIVVVSVLARDPRSSRSNFDTIPLSKFWWGYSMYDSWLFLLWAKIVSVNQRLPKNSFVPVSREPTQRHYDHVYQVYINLRKVIYNQLRRAIKLSSENQSQFFVIRFFENS